MKIKLMISLMAALGALTLSACRVDTSTEPIPEAEGSGKKRINIGIQPMSREEIKDATSQAIDKTADAAAYVKEAGTSATENVRDMAEQVTTKADAMLDDRRETPIPVESAQSTSPTM